MISVRDHVAHLAGLAAMAFVERSRRPFEGEEPEHDWLRRSWRTAAEDAAPSEQ